MKNEKGITLVSLIVYVIVMTIVIGIMSSIITNFYNNTDSLQGNVAEIVKYSKFNNYFLKEVKIKDNKVDTISTNYILFASGNSFSISNNTIFYNNIKICDGVKNMEIVKGENDNIINVKISFNNFEKTMNYKIEEIY